MRRRMRLLLRLARSLLRSRRAQLRHLSGLAEIERGAITGRLSWWLRPYDHTALSERRWRWQRRGCLRPEAIRQRAAVQALVEALSTCDALPPDVANPVPCVYPHGHSGQHLSTTGCAGSEIRWVS